MSAVDAIKLARKGLSVRSVARQAGVPMEVAEVIARRGAKDRLKDLEWQNANLQACLRKMIAERDALANEIAIIARQVECVKTAASKLLVNFDHRLKRLFKECNDAEALLAGKVRRRAV